MTDKRGQPFHLEAEDDDDDFLRLLECRLRDRQVIGFFNVDFKFWKRSFRCAFPAPPEDAVGRFRSPSGSDEQHANRRPHLVRRRGCYGSNNRWKPAVSIPICERFIHSRYPTSCATACRKRRSQSNRFHDSVAACGFPILVAANERGRPVTLDQAFGGSVTVQNLQPSSVAGRPQSGVSLD